MAIRAPDGANNAYSAFIFLKILSIQSKWSKWSERSRKVLLEPLDSQGGQDNHGGELISW